MKKILSIVLAMVMVLSFTACGKAKNVEFPFEVADIESVGIYRYNDPTDAKKKILTEQKDIEKVVNTLSRITLTDKKPEETEESVGNTVTSFKFNLKDGTDFNVIYVEEYKSGTLSLTDDDNEWIISEDIGSLWDTFSNEEIKADEDELPST